MSPRLLGLFLLLTLRVGAATYYFDANGPAEGSGAVSGSYSWSGSIWSASSAGTSATATLPSRNTVVFSAGVDGSRAALTLTGASGEMGGVIVEEGAVTIQSLTRIFVGGSTLQTKSGASLVIQNSPDFYNNTVTLATASGTTITLAGANSGGVRNAKLVKTGPGLVVFQGANIGASGGTLTVDEGEYRIQNSASLADGASAVNTGGTLSLAGNLTISRNLTVNGPGVSGLGALRAVSGSSTWNGTLSLASAARITADANAALNLAPASGDAIAGPFALALGGAGNLTVSRPISGLASLTKDGPGVLTLAAANTFAGNTTVSDGTLRLVETSGVLASLAGPLVIESTVEALTASAQTWGVPLLGPASGRFIKQGPGRLTLSGVHDFSGSLLLQSGSLDLASGALLPSVSRFELSANATLDVSAAAGFSFGSGQTLAGSGSVTGSVTFASGSALEPVPGAPVAVSGSVAFAAGATLRLPAALADGTYSLLRVAGGAITGSGNLALSGFVSPTQLASLRIDDSATDLALVVSTNPHTPRVLAWLGDGAANAWDAGASANWRAGDAAAVFTGSDHVLFDSTGSANPTVTLNGTLLPGSVAVSAATDYFLSGSGSLAGPMTLAKSGAGRLVISGAHSFTGNTTVSGGALELRTTGALGSGAVANSAALDLAPAASNALTLANPVSGPGALTVAGGAVTLSGDNSFSGPLVVSAGILLLGHPGALGSTAGGVTVAANATLDLAGFAIGAEPLTLSGGTLRNSASGVASIAGDITVAAPSTLRAAGPLTLLGALGGNSTLTLAEGVVSLTGVSPATASAFAVASGATLSGNGTLGGSLSVTGSLVPSGRFTAAGDVTLAPASKLSLRLGKTNGLASSDRLSVGGSLALGGSLVVSLSGEPLAAGDTFTLFDAGSVSGDFASVALPYLYADLVWDRSALVSSGVLRVQKLPAVSTAAQRREWLLAEAAADPSAIDGFVMAAAWLARGDLAEGRSLSLSRSRSLVAKIRSSPVQVDLFDMWPAADLVNRHGPLLNAETVANIRESLTLFTQYKDTNTANLRTLAWVTRHLGGQAFGEAAFSGLGIANYWRVADPDASLELASQLASLVRTGFGEHGSRPYYAKNLLPMLSVAQLSADPALRARAALAYEAGLAQNAHSWLRGHLGTPTSRSYPDVLRQQPISSLGMLWFHFGGDVFPRGNEAAVFAAVMNQPVSPILELAASDRSAPFASRALLGNAHHSGWVNRDYILFSDGPRSVGNFQVYPNGVVWTEPDTSRNSFLWVAKPWKDDVTLNSSNPHGRNSGQYKETQLRDAALYIYDIPVADALPYALANVPGGYRAAINEAALSGNLFLHYGSVLIAIRSEQPFAWDPAGGVANYSETPRAGDSEFRVYGTRFAIAIETARPADFPGATPSDQLSAFRSAVLARPGPASSAGAPAFATYLSRRGDTLRVALSADPAIRPVSHNGAPLNYNTWPTLESPWTWQDATGPLVLRSPSRRELLDFTSWTRVVQTAPAVDAPPGPLALGAGQTLDIDLFARASATPESPGPLAFSVGDAMNGSVALLADGRTARFAANAAGGPASFRFSARAPGVDPSQLVFLYDYEDDFLSSNWIADVSGHRLTGVTSTAGAGARSLVAAIPAPLAGLGARSLQLDQPTTTAAARFSHDLAVNEHDLSDADWTFCTWVRRATNTTHDMVFYLGSGDGFGGSGDELYLYFPAGSDTLRVHHYNTANTLDLDLATPASAPAGVWHHVAVTFARSGLNTGVVRLYLNGSLAAASAPVTWALNQGSPLVIGGNNSATGAGPDRWLNGRLDETVLFNRTLSDADVASLTRQSVSQFTGLESSAIVPLTVLTPLEQWRLAHFGVAAGVGSAGDLADPDADGLCNLLEYALGSTPTTAASVSRPTLSAAQPRLELTFVRARADLNYFVEGSPDLASWGVIAVNPGAVGHTVAVADTVDLGAANPRRFLRLRVQSP